MMNGCWLACHAACPQSGATFAADAIISNPPSFAHIHCAEALGIPLLLSFSESHPSALRVSRILQLFSNALVCSWFIPLRPSELMSCYRSPTTAFPHPLVNVSASNAESGLTNVLSYALAEILTWQGYVGSDSLSTKRH